MEKDVLVPTTREKMIDSTLDIIKEEGFQKVTVRKIAQRAGVNIASVNYHFGSKDAVINEALLQVTKNLMTCFEILKDKDLDAQTRLRKFLQDYTDVIENSPDIIRCFISQLINHIDINVAYGEYLKAEGFQLLEATLGDLLPGENGSARKMLAVQLMCCIGYPTLMGSFLTDVTDFDYSSREQRYKYLEVLIDRILT